MTVVNNDTPNSNNVTMEKLVKRYTNVYIKSHNFKLNFFQVANPSSGFSI